MKPFNSYWFITLALLITCAGCGGGDEDEDTDAPVVCYQKAPPGFVGPIQPKVIPCP